MITGYGNADVDRNVDGPEWVLMTFGKLLSLSREEYLVDQPRCERTSLIDQ